MVNILNPVVTTGPTYVKVANLPGLYRHARSGRYYACKKQGGIRRERSLGTSDRKIAERRLKEWVGNLDKVDAEVEKTTLGQLIERFLKVTSAVAENSRVTDNAIINHFLAWWPHGRDFQVRLIRPLMLDEWLAHEEPRLRNVTYNRYAGFLKQLFEIAVKDRMIAESPAKQLRLGWKKPQVPKRRIPTVEEFERIVENIRCQRFSDHAGDTADFVAFLGLAGLGQAETSSLTWGDVDWANNRLHIRRHKTDTRFVVPIYDPLRPLLERMRKERRGRVSATSLVFKIKDAKRGLNAACKRLHLPPFCQRSLRQHLIMRLWKAGVDKKLIARWQGHQDGGELILSTYTEVFGGDDAEYERGQLAKLSSGMVVTDAAAVPSGSGVDGSTSGKMKKGPTKHDAHSDSHSAGAAHPAPPAVKPYAKGDKVTTACKGADVEAEVTAVFQDEVQVRTPDGELRWRTVRTVQPVVVLLTPPDPMDEMDGVVPLVAAPRKGGKGAPFARKHRMHLELLARMLRDELPERIAGMATMAQAFAGLRTCPTIGDFLAYQYATDLNYSILTDFNETEFVVPGPGALSGLRKCFADTGRLTDAEVIRLVQERQNECFAAAGVAFSSLPGRPLQLIDVQNLFCEVDKYARAAYPQFTSPDGRCRIKQRFQPAATMSPLWYPPKWGINGRLNILSA